MLQIDRENYPRLSLLPFYNYLLPNPVLDLTWLQLLSKILGYTIFCKLSASTSPKAKNKVASKIHKENFHLSDIPLPINSVNALMYGSFCSIAIDVHLSSCTIKHARGNLNNHIWLRINYFIPSRYKTKN